MDRRHVSARLNYAELVESIDNTGRIKIHRGHCRPNERATHFWLYTYDHSEVEQNKAAIIGYEKISGMRIGMKESIDEHHLDVRLDHRLNHLLPGDATVGDQLGE